MRRRRNTSLLRFGSLLAFALALGACTKGGQFDPTTLLDNDMFDSKKPLKGEREPVFPGGVPGVQSGVPKDLYKGYQPPPEEAAAETVAPPPPAPEPAKPKPKPKPKVATTSPPTARPEISVGLSKQPAQGGAQSPWPNPSPPPAAQTAWPASPSAAPAQKPAQGGQSPWPAPPATGQAQQTGQSSQSIWPDPPATSSH